MTAPAAPPAARPAAAAPPPAAAAPPVTPRAEWPAALAALALVAVLWLAARLFGTPLFHTFDDPLLQLIASGRAVVARADRHLLFSHVLLGDLLLALRRVAGQDVYARHVLFASWLGLGVGAFALLRLARGRAAALVAAAVVALPMPTLASRPQFTLAAGVLGAGAAALAISLLVRPPARRAAAAAAWGLVVAVVVYGVLTRVQGALSVGVGLGPVLLYALWRARAAERWVAVGVAGLLGAAVVGLGAVDRRAYAGPEWARYLDAERYRATFVDYDRVLGTEAQAAAYRRGGFSVNDVRLVRANYLVPPIAFTARRAEAVLAAIPAYPGGTRALRAVRELVPALLRDPYVAPATLAAGVLLLALLAAPATRPAGLASAAGLLMALAVFAAVGILGRGGHARVYVPALTGLALAEAALLLAFAPAVRGAPGRAGLVGQLRGLRASPVPAAALALGLPAVAQAALYVRHAPRADRLIADAAADMARLAPRADELYVAWDIAIPAAHLVTPRGADPNFAAGSWFWLTTQSLTPTSLAQLDRFGARDLSAALVGRPDVHLVALPYQVERLVAMYREHYGRAVTACARFRGETITVWRLRAADARPCPPTVGSGRGAPPGML
jgi:hypothetical protein